MIRNRYREGHWLAVCDRCSFDYYDDQLKKEWTGLMVCHNCYEKRHEQDFLKGREDSQSVPWARPAEVIDAGTYFYDEYIEPAYTHTGDI